MQAVYYLWEIRENFKMKEFKADISSGNQGQISTDKQIKTFCHLLDHLIHCEKSNQHNDTHTRL